MNRHFSVPYLVHPEVMLFKLCEQNIWFYPLTYMLIPVLLVQCISYISSFSKFRSTILRLLSSVRIVIDITGTSVENWQGNQLSVTQLDPLTCSWGHSSTFFFVHDCNIFHCNYYGGSNGGGVRGRQAAFWKKIWSCGNVPSKALLVSFNVDDSDHPDDDDE